MASTSKDDQPIEYEVEPKVDTTFYFESDHLALKGNVDYLKLLKHLAMLQTEQNLVVQDLQFYYNLEKQINETSKPSEIAKKIASGEIKVPPKRKISKRPTIDLAKYNLQKLQDDISTQKNTTQIDQKPITTTTILTQTKDVTKPETFNKPWSAEEQIKLEELLMKYPPEKSDSARFRKIAQDLGNRTVKQVCSRVQKYVKKMKRLGVKNSAVMPLKKSLKDVKQLYRRDKFLVRQSTFLPALAVQSENKFFMSSSSEEEQEEEQSDKHNTSTEEVHNEDVKKSDNKYQTEQWLRILKRIKSDMINEKEMKNVLHNGYQCSICKENPIRGTRWHCLSCSCKDITINLCNDCTVLQIDDTQHRTHPLNHLLQPNPLNNFKIVTTEGQPLDLNYLPSYAFQSTSYLDPNLRSDY